MNKNQYLVLVEWNDALSYDGWRTMDEATKWARDRSIEVCIDVGFLVKKTKSYILISPSFSERSCMFDYLKKIPMGMVKKITRL